jgi:hypothetical protein
MVATFAPLSISEVERIFGIGRGRLASSAKEWIFVLAKDGNINPVNRKQIERRPRACLPGEPEQGIKS